MDGHEHPSVQPPPHAHQHLQQPPQSVPLQPPPPGMMMSPNNSYPTSGNLPNTNPQMINPNSSTMFQSNRFPFNSVGSAPSSTKPLEPLNSTYSADGSSGLRPGGFSIDPTKKKRGRPRKYSPDGGSNIALGLAPTPISSAGATQGDSGGTPSSEGPSKRNRGRPAGSGKKQLDALGNCGVGFTPHVIFVKAGEDIASKIMAFSQQGPRTVCILSANGSICNVTLRQPAMSGGTVTYEGRFEIISLSGSFLLSDNGGSSHVRTGGLSVSLAGSDGRVLGGGVAGMLMAATPVQIIVGSFIADGKKAKYMPSVPESRMLSFSASMPAASPPSQAPSSESSDGNGDSPIDRAVGGPYNNPGQQFHNAQMYSSMGWPNTTSKMHPN
ncbi:hypothetical protein Ancab_032987 [Ancistrocladus abbreviatus]